MTPFARTILTGFAAFLLALFALVAVLIAIEDSVVTALIFFGVLGGTVIAAFLFSPARAEYSSRRPRENRD